MSSSPEVGRHSENDLSGCIDTPSLQLVWSEAPWDSVLFGAPVLQIGALTLRDAGAQDDIAAFVEARDRAGAMLVSCRLRHEQLAESMLLEQIGFRFIEMLYQPERGLATLTPSSHGLAVCRAGADDMAEILEAAGSAFNNERFHMDPRLSSAIGDIRYQNWVRSSLDHPLQRLYALRDGTNLVAFFVTEMRADGTCYWHLTAVAPGLQGRGYGRRAWEAMLEQARNDGAARVQTCIVARNHRVLNLYARLGFRFPPPLMTLHWVRPA